MHPVDHSMLKIKRPQATGHFHGHRAPHARNGLFSILRDARARARAAAAAGCPAFTGACGPRRGRCGRNLNNLNAVVDIFAPRPPQASAAEATPTPTPTPVPIPVPPVQSDVQPSEAEKPVAAAPAAEVATSVSAALEVQAPVQVAEVKAVAVAVAVEQPKAQDLEPELAEFPYRQQLEEIRSMGFPFSRRLLSLLKKHKGNVPLVIDIILG